MGVEIDHNEIEGGGPNHAIDPRSSCTTKDNFYIHHNYLHDNTDSTVDAAIVMNLGNSCDSNSTVEYNLVTNWRGNHSIYDKGGATVFAFNTILNSSDVSNRGFSRITPDNTVVGSTRNEWIANWIEGTFFLIHGADNRIIGNRVTGGNFRLGCGNWVPGEAPDDTSQHKGFVAATNNLLAGNIGELTVGLSHEDICAGTAGWAKKDINPAKNNKIQAHQGAIEYGKHVGTQVSQTTSVTVPQAKKLTPADVGPNAPTAPKF